MGGLLQKYVDEDLEVGLGIASLFKDDDLRADQIVAIPDLAAGAFSESLSQLGKTNITTTTVGPSGANLYLQTKTSLISAWRLDKLCTKQRNASKNGGPDIRWKQHVDENQLAG